MPVIPVIAVAGVNSIALITAINVPPTYKSAHVLFLLCVSSLDTIIKPDLPCCDEYPGPASVGSPTPS